jgi:hypothetical protein
LLVYEIFNILGDEKRQAESSLPPISGGFFLGLRFDSEDEGDMVL